MTRAKWCLAALLAVYLASGFYIVRGNEQALVRRFGKARLPLVAGGLHYDLPWPFSQVDRVNVNEVRTITVGMAPAEAFDGAGFLRDVNLDREAEFLTADKNILNVQVNVHYAVADPLKFLFESQTPETGLKLLAESLVTDAIARSSVDYVHPLGLNELRMLLSQTIREAAAARPWGVAVEDVTITGVLPPVEVKAAFLDVSNARAERERLINQEQSRAERQVSAARATAQQTLDRAEVDRNARVESARGSADRFLKVIAEFDRASPSTPQSRTAARRAAMQRALAKTLEDLLPRLAGKVLLDTQQPADLTIFPAADAPAPGSGGGKRMEDRK